MPARKIITFGNRILRLQAKPIEQIDESIDRLVEDMIETMHEEEGIGLAAPQVAESVALCVVNTHLITEGESPRVYINPRIYEEEGNVTLEEGCLSIPDIREDVARSERIKLRYLDREGVERDEECEGLLARVLQHEIDHLSGILFIDRIGSMKRQLLSKKLKAIASV